MTCEVLAALPLQIEKKNLLKLELSGIQANNIMQQIKGRLGEATILHCNLTFQYKQAKFCS